MAELSHDKHRKRVREAYIKSGTASMSDHHLLELILFYAIPRKDVKPVAYNLINSFGSLENVLNAEIDELMQVSGVGESTAVLISLFNETNNRIALNRNTVIKKLNHFEISKKYVGNILKGINVEKLIAITLTSSLDIINCHIISSGTVTSANVEPRKIIAKAINDNAASIILAHNHPHGSYLPSKGDIEFTLELIKLFEPLDIILNDHIIVGENGILSMSHDVRYIDYFKK